VEFDLSTKKNDILSFARKCMELENIIWSEVSQVSKKPYVFLSYLEYRPHTSTRNAMKNKSH
jgi:hypothetical protein